jgi:hypothetical protein
MIQVLTLARFMQSDPWWSLAMAINVFLVFYFRTSPGAFKKWWWAYCVVCYGGPFIIAISLLLVRNHGRPPVYGEATIWCWVDRQWDDIRIYTYYMLIWICIIGSFLCYFMVGYNVFHSRNNLRSFSSASKSKETTHVEHMRQPRVELPDVPQDGFYGTVITEVQIVHSNVNNAAGADCLPSPHRPKQARVRETVQVSFDEPPVDSNAEARRGSSAGDPTRQHYYSSVTSPNKSLGFRPTTLRRSSSLNGVSGWTRNAANKFVVDDPIKRAYLRTSFLFALSVLVTWIPSSMNRIHSWQTGTSPFEYHVATASVLPLQGLWNAIIFFVTSWNAVAEYWSTCWLKRRFSRKSSSHVVDEMALQTRHYTNRMGASEREPWGVGRMDSDEEFGDSGTLASDIELRGIMENSDKVGSSV